MKGCIKVIAYGLLAMFVLSILASVLGGNTDRSTTTGTQRVNRQAATAPLSQSSSPTSQAPPTDTPPPPAPLPTATSTTAIPLPTPTTPPATDTPAPVVVAASSVSNQLAQKGIVNTSALNVRAGPGTGFDIVGRLVLDECIDVLGEQDGWLQVRKDPHLFGWCSQEYITLSDACPIVPQQVAVMEEPVTTVAAEQATPVVAAVQSASIQPASYIGQPFVPNATLVKDTYLFECFGAGDNELRLVTANTPVQVLGTGPFVPPYAVLGDGPFLKNRIWDGQYAWIPADAVGVDLSAQPAVSGICEEFDRINWAAVVPPTPTVPASRATDSPSPSRSCCRVCTTGKACGNSCIAANKTCRVGPGCACNG